MLGPAEWMGIEGKRHSVVGVGEDDGRIFKGIYVGCVIAKQTNKQK